MNPPSYIELSTKSLPQIFLIYIKREGKKKVEYAPIVVK